MKMEKVDLAELIQHCYEIFSQRALENDVSLNVEMEAKPIIIGDIDRLEQAISNLIDNAIKHTPAHGTVTISTKAENKALIAIAVVDTGRGIPQQQLSHVFERFYKGVDDKMGTGLGLAITQEIVQAHEGEVNVESSVGVGTSFIIRLPLRND
jgi:signal transduction histidine kinase